MCAGMGIVCLAAALCVRTALATLVVASLVEDNITKLGCKVEITRAGTRMRPLMETVVTASVMRLVSAVAGVRMATDIMATAMVVAIASVSHVILPAGSRHRARTLCVPA